MTTQYTNSTFASPITLAEISVCKRAVLNQSSDYWYGKK